MLLQGGNEPVLHLVHPRPVPWSHIITAFAVELKLPVIPYDDWLVSLQESGRALDSAKQAQAEVEEMLEQNPALRLLTFFASAKGKMGADVEPLGIPRLASEKAQNVSESLRNAREISEDCVKRWIAYWRSNGFISEESPKGVKRRIDQLS